MAFKEFLNESIRDMKEKERVDMQRSGGLVAENYDDRNISLWIGYKTIESTKHLIWATWFLAIATIILSIISLFVK